MRIFFYFSKIFEFRSTTSISHDIKKVELLILIKMTFWTLGQQLLFVSIWEVSLLSFKDFFIKMDFLFFNILNFQNSRLVCLFVNSSTKIYSVPFNEFYSEFIPSHSMISTLNLFYPIQWILLWIIGGYQVWKVWNSDRVPLTCGMR